MQKSLIALAALVTMCSALAAPPTDDMLFEGTSVVVRLSDTPCDRPSLLNSLKGIGAELPARVASVLFEGKVLFACWSPKPETGVVLLVDETGDGGAIPMGAFRRVPSI